MTEYCTATPIRDLLVWPYESAQSSAHTIASVEAILGIARAETGAVACILAIANDSHIVHQKKVAGSRSSEYRFLDRNAGIVQECLRTRSIVVCGGIQFGQQVYRASATSPSPIGMVVVPVMHKASPAGCMLLVFTQPGGLRNLQSGLKGSLLQLGAAIALLVDRDKPGELEISSVNEHSASVSSPLPGRLSELKSVLQDDYTSWEDIGQQLSSYLQTAFGAASVDCPRPDKRNGENGQGNESATTEAAHSYQTAVHYFPQPSNPEL